MYVSKFTNIDFDLLPTMEGDHSQNFPGVYANKYNGPSVSKAKVIKSDSLRILYYNARSLQRVCSLSWMNYLQQLKLKIFLTSAFRLSLGWTTMLETRKLQFQTIISFVMIFRGGILIYVKHTVLPGAPTDLEITICVQSGNCKACFSLFYRPPQFFFSYF